MSDQAAGGGQVAIHCRIRGTRVRTDEVLRDVGSGRGDCVYARLVERSQAIAIVGLSSLDGIGGRSADVKSTNILKQANIVVVIDSLGVAPNGRPYYIRAILGGLRNGHCQLQGGNWSSGVGQTEVNRREPSLAMPQMSVAGQSKSDSTYRVCVGEGLVAGVETHDERKQARDEGQN